MTIEEFIVWLKQEYDSLIEQFARVQGNDQLTLIQYTEQESELLGQQQLFNKIFALLKSIDCEPSQPVATDAPRIAVPVPCACGSGINVLTCDTDGRCPVCNGTPF